MKKSFGVSHFSTFSTLKKGSESNPYPKIISVQKQFKVGTKNVFMKKSFDVSHSAHFSTFGTLKKGSESNPYVFMKNSFGVSHSAHCSTLARESVSISFSLVQN